MKSLRDKMRELLLAESAGMLGYAEQTSMAMPFMGPAPSTMVILFGKAEYDSAKCRWIIQDEEMESFLFSAGEYVPVPASRLPSQKKIGNFFEEAFAEVGYDGAGKGFMDIIFGHLFGRGFEMEVVEKDEFCEIIDGKETWVS